MSEKKVSKMGQAVNWADEIGAIAGSFDGNRKSWLARAARTAGVTFRQVKALYYGEIDDPRHSVATSILTAAEEARIRETQSNARLVADYLTRYAQTASATDADFNGPQIDAALSVLRQIGGGSSA
jgi:hypothetical protein